MVLCMSSLLSSADVYASTFSSQLSPAIEKCKRYSLPLPSEQIRGWIYSVILKGMFL